MIIILYSILIYSLLGSITFLIEQMLNGIKNKYILMANYAIVFFFSPIIDLILYLDEKRVK